MIHQDFYNKHYVISYFKDHIVVYINFLPRDKFNRNEIYYDLVVFYKIKNTIIRYKDKIFYNEEELRYFFKHTSKSIQITPYHK